MSPAPVESTVSTSNAGILFKVPFSRYMRPFGPRVTATRLPGLIFSSSTNTFVRASSSSGRQPLMYCSANARELMMKSDTRAVCTVDSRHVPASTTTFALGKRSTNSRVASGSCPSQRIMSGTSSGNVTFAFTLGEGKLKIVLVPVLPFTMMKLKEVLTDGASRR